MPLKSYTDDDLNLKFVDIVQAVARTLDEIVKGSHSAHAARHNSGGADVLTFPAVYADKLNLIIAMGATPDEQVDVDADCLTMFNTAEEAKSVVDINLTIDNTVAGANGIDTGAVANDTWYYIWVIAKVDGTVAGIFSVSYTIATITLPAGYTYARLIGAIRTDGTSDFIPGTWDNDWFNYDIGQEVYSGNGVVAWTNSDLSNYIPEKISKMVIVRMFTNAGSNSVGFRKDGDTIAYAIGANSFDVTPVLIPITSAGVIEYLNAFNSRAITWGVNGYKNIIGCNG